MTAEARFDPTTHGVTVTGHHDKPDAGEAAVACAREHGRVLIGVIEDGETMTYPTTALPEDSL